MLARSAATVSPMLTDAGSATGEVKVPMFSATGGIWVIYSAICGRPSTSATTSTTTEATPRARPTAG